MFAFCPVPCYYSRGIFFSLKWLRCVNAILVRCPISSLELRVVVVASSCLLPPLVGNSLGWSKLDAPVLVYSCARAQVDPRFSHEVLVGQSAKHRNSCL